MLYNPPVPPTCLLGSQVSLLVVVEIGVFPLICGWWLDICSLVRFLLFSSPQFYTLFIKVEEGMGGVGGVAHPSSLADIFTALYLERDMPVRNGVSVFLPGSFLCEGGQNERGARRIAVFLSPVTDARRSGTQGNVVRCVQTKTDYPNQLGS